MRDNDWGLPEDRLRQERCHGLTAACTDPSARSRRRRHGGLSPTACRLPRGVSLMEVLIALAVIGVLVSMSVPSFRRSMEQSRADIAGANLRAIWSAERIYWLEYRCYTTDLSALESAGLLDPTIVSGTPQYAYAVASADSNSFTAAAARRGSAQWSGQFSISENGEVSGVLQATGEPNIVPGFQ